MAFKVDYNKYLPYLDEFDEMSEDDKKETLDALCEIIQSFVDLGFNSKNRIGGL